MVRLKTIYPLRHALSRPVDPPWLPGLLGLIPLHGQQQRHPRDFSLLFRPQWA
jgi:hypothetical protein